MENRKGDELICSQHYCIGHPDTVSRIAMLEKGMSAVELNIKEANETLQGLRSDIVNGIMHRYPATVVWIISILTAFCSALLTALLSHFVIN